MMNDLYLSEPQGDPLKPSNSNGSNNHTPASGPNSPAYDDFSEQVLYDSPEHQPGSIRDLARQYLEGNSDRHVRGIDKVTLVQRLGKTLMELEESRGRVPELDPQSVAPDVFRGATFKQNETQTSERSRGLISKAIDIAAERLFAHSRNVLAFISFIEELSQQGIISLERSERHFECGPSVTKHGPAMPMNVTLVTYRATLLPLGQEVLRLLQEKVQTAT